LLPFDATQWPIHRDDRTTIGLRIGKEHEHGIRPGLFATVDTPALTKSAQVRHQILELRVRDPLFAKRGHRSEPMTYLKFLQERGKRLIVERRAEPCFTARMALMAMGHEHGPPALCALIQIDGHRQWLASPCRAACSADEERPADDPSKQKGAVDEHSITPS
jgi:hypothetical protein